MEFELHPRIAVETGTFTLIMAPLPMMLEALNWCDALQQYATLYISGNYSQLLSGIHRTRQNLDVQRGFTGYQLLTILQEAPHTILFIEHDPGLYEGEEGRRLIFPASMAMREAARNAAVILYAPGITCSLRRIARRADRVYCFLGYTPLRQRTGQTTLDLDAAVAVSFPPPAALPGFQRARDRT